MRRTLVASLLLPLVAATVLASPTSPGFTQMTVRIDPLGLAPDGGVGVYLPAGGYWHMVLIAKSRGQRRAFAERVGHLAGKCAYVWVTYDSVNVQLVTDRLPVLALPRTTC